MKNVYLAVMTKNAINHTGNPYQLIEHPLNRSCCFDSDVVRLLYKAIEDYLKHVDKDAIFTQKLQEYLRPETRDKSQVTLMLHDHIKIHGVKQFQGFKSFSVYANRHYRGPTKSYRERFDCVEIAIEAFKGEGMVKHAESCSSRNYLRFSYVSYSWKQELASTM